MTPRQQKYLNLIKKFVSKHGYSPTYAELAKLAGIKSVAPCFNIVAKLVAEGHLVFDSETSARSIRLPDALKTCQKNHPQIWYRVAECPCCQLLAGLPHADEIRMDCIMLSDWKPVKMKEGLP